MRQVGDTLVWLGLIMVVAAVVYFTPRFASYLSVRDKDALYDARGRVVYRSAEPVAVPAEEAR